MRGFDVWVGRLVAVAGLVYVVLCSVWPLGAVPADEEPAGRPGSSPSSSDGGDPAALATRLG